MKDSLGTSQGFSLVHLHWGVFGLCLGM